MKKKAYFLLYCHIMFTFFFFCKQVSFIDISLIFYHVCSEDLQMKQRWFDLEVQDFILD